MPCRSRRSSRRWSAARPNWSRRTRSWACIAGLRAPSPWCRPALLLTRSGRTATLRVRRRCCSARAVRRFAAAAPRTRVRPTSPGGECGGGDDQPAAGVGGDADPAGFGGFMLFHLAFLLRGTTTASAVRGRGRASSLGTMIGNAIAPRAAAEDPRGTMITVALGLHAAVAGIGAPSIGGAGAGIALAAVVDFSAAIGRLSFESIVQRDGPETNRGQAFASFETRFQLAWVAAAFLPCRSRSRAGRAPVRRRRRRGRAGAVRYVLASPVEAPSPRTPSSGSAATAVDLQAVPAHRPQRDETALRHAADPGDPETRSFDLARGRHRVGRSSSG